jgi:hypothetical protein
MSSAALEVNKDAGEIYADIDGVKRLKLTSDALTLMAGVALAVSSDNETSYGTYLRWTRFVPPAGDVSLDRARMQDALDAVAGKGRVFLSSASGGSGTYLIGPRSGDGYGVEFPSDTYLEAHPHCVLQSSIPDTAGADPRASVFWAEKGAVGVQTTLNADAAKYATSVSVTATTIAVGSIIRFNSVAKLFHAATRVVMAVSGGGHTLELDEPLLEAFASGDGVSVLASVPTRCYLIGVGATFTGSGERAIELADAGWCRAIGWKIAEATMVGNLVAMDVGGRHNVIDDMDIDACATGILGAALESNDHSIIGKLVKVRRATQLGIGVLDCNESGVEKGATATESPLGIALTADGNTSGCSDCWIDGTANKCTTAGIAVVAGSSGSRIGGGGGGSPIGLLIGGDGSAPTGTKVAGKFTRNTIGIQIGLGAKQTALRDVDLSNNVTTALDIHDDCEVDGITSDGVSGTSPTIAIAAGRVVCKRANLTQTVPGSLCIEVTGGTLSLHDSLVTTDGGSFGLVVRAGASARVGRTKFAGCSVGIYGAAGGPVNREDGVDTSTCTTGYTSASGNQFSFGSFNANGATDVDVPFTGATAADRLVITRRADGGTPGPTPKHKSTTAGTKYVVTGTALDTSTYDFTVVR